MDSLFCCSSIEPFRPRIIDNEGKFKNFTNWARACGTILVPTIPNSSDYLSVNSGSCFVVQLVRQVNYGPLESKRFFAKTIGTDAQFSEVTEKDLIAANYQKVNSFKNFKCVAHNKFFELNLYEKDPVNRHHWRVNIARPATEIDLATQSTGASEMMTPPLRAPDGSDPLLPQATTTNSSLDPPMLTTVSGMFLPPGRHSQGTGDDKEVAHGEVGKKSGMGSLPRQTPLQGPQEEAGDESEGDRFGDCGSYDDHFDGGDWRSDGSQSPKDFTACSSSDCGNCGHCTY